MPALLILIYYFVVPARFIYKRYGQGGLKNTTIKVESI